MREFNDAKEFWQGAPMTVLDVLLIVIMLVSAALAMARGLVREIVSIIPWISAAVVSYSYYDSLMPIAKGFVDNDILAIIASVVTIAVTVLLITIYATRKLSAYLLKSRIGALDRSFGFVFGAARGLLLMVIGVLVFNWFAPESHHPSWIAQSKSKSFLDSVSQSLMRVLPNSSISQSLEINRIDTNESNQSESENEEKEGNSYTDSDRNRLKQLSTSSNN